MYAARPCGFPAVVQICSRQICTPGVLPFAPSGPHLVRSKLLQAVLSNEGFESSPLSPPHINKPLIGACLCVAERASYIKMLCSDDRTSASDP